MICVLLRPFKRTDEEASRFQIKNSYPYAYCIRRIITHLGWSQIVTKTFTFSLFTIRMLLISRLPFCYRIKSCTLHNRRKNNSRPETVYFIPKDSDPLRYNSIVFINYTTGYLFSCLWPFKNKFQIMKNTCSFFVYIMYFYIQNIQKLTV